MCLNILFERDLLYPTENLNEPGSIRIQVLNPNNNARIPVIIENKSGHSPLKYMDSIVRIMQTEIFDRIFVDIRKNVILYIAENNKASEKPYKKVIYSTDGFEYSETDIVE